MNEHAAPTFELYDLLARTWPTAAPVAALAFSGDGTTAVFALADGTLALAGTADDEAPETRIRMSADVGRATIRPRSAPVPALRSLAVGGGAAALASFDGADVLVGTGSGRVVAVDPGGTARETGLAAAGPIVALDHCPKTGMTVASDGTGLLMTVDLGLPVLRRDSAGPPIRLLRLSPDGRHVAVVRDRQLTVSPVDGEPDAAAIALPARPTAVAWRAGGRWLACPLETGGFALVDLAAGTAAAIGGFPVAVETAEFSTPADAVVASGAFRIAAWSMAALSARGGDAAGSGVLKTGVLETGRRGFVAVSRLAVHPKKKLVAAAYDNGQIVVAQIGAPDELVVRGRGGRVTALAWSPNGRHLAVGGSDGTAALVGLPPQIFK